MFSFNLHFGINKCVSGTLLTMDKAGLWLKQLIENLRVYAQAMKVQAEVDNFDKEEDLRTQVNQKKLNVLVWSLCPEYSVRVLRVVCTVLAFDCMSVIFVHRTQKPKVVI